MIVVISEHCQGRACGCIKKMVQLQLDWIVSRCVGGVAELRHDFLPHDEHTPLQNGHALHAFGAVCVAARSRPRLHRQQPRPKPCAPRQHTPSRTLCERDEQCLVDSSSGLRRHQRNAGRLPDFQHPSGWYPPPRCVGLYCLPLFVSAKNSNDRTLQKKHQVPTSHKSGAVLRCLNNAALHPRSDKAIKMVDEEPFELG